MSKFFEAHIWPGSYGWNMYVVDGEFTTYCRFSSKGGYSGLVETPRQSRNESPSTDEKTLTSLFKYLYDNKLFKEQYIPLQIDEECKVTRV